MPLTVGPLLDAIGDGSVDAGFVHILAKLPEFDTIPLLTADWLLALPRNHRLAQQDTITLKDLVDEPFVWRRSSTSLLYDRLLHACRLKSALHRQYCASRIH